MSWEVPDDPRIDAADDDPLEIACEVCNETGYLPDDSTCPKCHGRKCYPNPDLEPPFRYCLPRPL